MRWMDSIWMSSKNWRRAYQHDQMVVRKVFYLFPAFSDGLRLSDIPGGPFLCNIKINSSIKHLLELKKK